MKRLLLNLSFLLLTVISLNAQITAYKPGEVLVYTGSYYMSGAWTDLAQITMKVNQTSYKGVPLYKLSIITQTYQEWDSYFKIRDIYQSWINPKTGLPLLFSRNVDEGGYKIIVKYSFSRKTNTANVYLKFNKNPERRFKTRITPKTFDMVSLGYYMRNLDFKGAPVGKVYPMDVLIDGKLHHIKIIYKGTAYVNNKVLGKVKCYKLGMILGDARLDNPNNLIYVTADNKKIPVFLKATIPVGNIQARLVKATGIK